METTILSAAEAVEYGEFKRSRREAEIAVQLKNLIVDASRRETDKYALKSACDSAKKLGASGVLVSPVNVVAARRQLSGCGAFVVCLVGGTGESLAAVKKTEAVKAMRQGAREIRLVVCYSALTQGNEAYLKKEIKKVKRAAKKCAVVVSLEDHNLAPEEVALGVRAAVAGKADGVCVRGEYDIVVRAAEAGGGKLRTDVSGVENAEQLKSLFRAGALHATTACGERIASELYRAAAEAATVSAAPAEGPPSKEQTE